MAHYVWIEVFKLHNDRLPGVGANPIPNCKLGFGLCVRSDCV